MCGVGIGIRHREFRKGKKQAKQSSTTSTVVGLIGALAVHRDPLRSMGPLDFPDAFDTLLTSPRTGLVPPWIQEVLI